MDLDNDQDHFSDIVEFATYEDDTHFNSITDINEETNTITIRHWEINNTKGTISLKYLERLLQQGTEVHYTATYNVQLGSVIDNAHRHTEYRLLAATEQKSGSTLVITAGYFEPPRYEPPPR